MSAGATLTRGQNDCEERTGAIGQWSDGIEYNPKPVRHSALLLETSSVANPRQLLGLQLRRGQWVRNPDSWISAVITDAEWGVNQDSTSWHRMRAEFLRMKTQQTSASLSVDDFPSAVVHQANQMKAPSPRRLVGKKLKGLARSKPARNEIEDLLEE